ncbi:MAG TPA: hypothetical protein VLQ65_02765, partial [Saliniramus sp.]|nr:hypothetical protein [Saliniramus sp.]
QKRHDVLGFAPLACAVAAAAIVAVAGITQRELAATPFGPYAYGFFFDRFAPFAFAIVYAVARLVVVALASPGRFPVTRLVTTPVAIAAILAVSLYPTFGGFVLRGAFFSGATTFLEGTALPGAYIVGAGFSTLIFASVLGVGVGLVRLRFERTRAALLFALLRYLALVFAGIVLVAPRIFDLGLLGDWPVWPLGAGEGASLVALVLVALLPHALIVRLRG